MGKKKITQPEKQKNKGVKHGQVEQKKSLSPDAIKKFQKIIYGYYQKYGRSLPWRMTHDPYRILVSEIMLQQTQVQRVIGKYESFLKVFPDFYSLSRAPLKAVLKEWQGLGYNRRAMALKQIAQKVIEEFGGVLPSSVDALIAFPGIGRATASAISAFAFHKPTAFIETNIRRVFIHSFFHDENNIKDTEILFFVEKTLDTSNPREWYYALMDYGVMLKKDYENPNRRSAHYQKQSPFQGSNRQIRGKILKVLTCEPYISEGEIGQKLQVCPEKLRDTLFQLQKEGFIKRRWKKIIIA